MSKRYRRSEDMLAKASKLIPLGTQTFSKSKTQYPFGVSPYFVQRGKGSRVWDVDGNLYIDFVNALAAITLGYNDPDVIQAVLKQLKEGVIFSLPHPLEMQVARKMTEMVPCAEQVRFGKNGSDATAGAVRLARAFTRRDHVAVCGYHGWQDWYIGSTSRNLGVPQATRELSHVFSYNDTTSLEAIFKKYPKSVAAVILEPMNTTEPRDGFLQKVKKIAHREGAVLIFDEVITGFRFANGGAQEYFGVTPDLATFGKGISNGYPLSAVAGKKEIMSLMEEVFFSFTFGGETLSLAAGLATMTKLQKRPVLKTIAAKGEKVLTGFRRIVKKTKTGELVSANGHPSWSFLLFRDAGNFTQHEIRTFFLQEMFARGILILGTHNMSYAHTDRDIENLLGAHEEVLSLIRRAVDSGNLRRKLRCDVLKPLFKVRG